MIEINKELKMKNLLSKRMKISQTEIPVKLEEIKKMCEINFFIVKSLTTLTHNLEKIESNMIYDLEILIELQNDLKEVSIPYSYTLKERINITNALFIHYEGQKNGSYSAFKEINNYIVDNNLMAITPVYSVSNNPFSQSEDKIDLYIYVGINPNIM